jgi:hypothetical protein
MPSSPLEATAALGAPPAHASSASVQDAYAKLPLSFEQNLGQTDPKVDFLARGSGYTLFLTQGEAVLTLRAPERSSDPTSRRDIAKALSDPNASAVLRMALAGGNPAAQATAESQLSGTVNYFIGNDPAHWQVGLSTYARVRYPDVYPGVDLVYYGDGGRLEYDFIVQPGADPAAIVLRFEGAESLDIDARGDLVLRLGDREIRQAKPILYQQIGGERRQVSGAYLRRDRGTVGLEIAEYDRMAPLVVDPTLIYSTYLGGSSGEVGFGIAVDSAFSAYATGVATSTNFPTTPGVFQPALVDHDVYVTKFNVTGSALVYSTYLGGSSADVGLGIAVDSAGSAYVTGQTGSTDFPTTGGAFQTTLVGHSDAFVTKFNATGSALVYSTYLGGSGAGQGDDGRGIAVDSAGGAYVTGFTNSNDFPTTPGAFQTTNAGGQDAFVTKLNATGSAPLMYSTYLGGSADESGSGIAVDSAATVYVTGETTSTNFPTTAGAFQTTNAGGSDAFVTKLNATGSAPLLYSTYLGGSSSELGSGIAVDSAGSAYVAGLTGSANFSTTAGAFQTANAGNGDAFVTKLNATGSAPLLYSTYLGGSDLDVGYGIAVDSSGSAYVTGRTSSTNFPTTADAFQTANAGNEDAFVTKLNATGSAPLLYSTYLGGSGTDDAFGIAVDSAGSAYVTGVAGSTNFPTTPGAFQTANAGSNDAFVAKIAESVSPPMLCEVTITNGGWIRADNGDRASVGGNAKVLPDGTVQGQQEYQDQGPAQPMNVHSIEITATTCNQTRTTATIVGRATINGTGSHIFRIEVTDMSKIGGTDSYGITLDTGYASGQHTLGGGQITIH